MGLLPGTRLGPYEIVAPIGAGGMGEVYRATDSRLDRSVAIKVLPAHVVDHPTRRQRFQREARAVSQLSHPHICALYDVGEQDGVHFIVMEFLAGETLAERLRSGPLPLDDALRYAIEVADALDHAHRQGIVHRDLKPANIMLTRTGAKLLDFGVARFQRPDSDVTHSLAGKATDTLTEDGMVLGTLQYMAPEQLEGKEADARTDIFALGAVTYEMTTGRRPFDAPSTAGLIAAILNAEPPPLTAARGNTSAELTRLAPLAPPLLEHVVSRCLAKDPDARWQTAADVRQELKWIAEGSGRLAGAAGLQTGATAQTRRGRRRRVWIAIAAALVIAGAIYAARFVEWRGPAPLPTFKQLTFRRGSTTQARFTRDGQTILFSAAWDGNPVQTFEMRSGNPAWSAVGPRGAGLASVSSTNELALIENCVLDYGACRGTLARMPLSGGAPRAVLADVVDADWTPEGSQLAVIHEVLGEPRVEFPIGTTLYKSNGKLQAVAFSPNGDRLAFIEHPVVSEEAGDLVVVDLQGHSTTLSKGWKTIRHLRWSPHGDEIWFSGSENSKIARLYAVSMTGVRRLVLETPGDMTLYDVARDGRVLLSHGTPRARVILANAGGERELSWLDWSTVADLSADGKTLLFFEWGEGVGASPVVYLREVNGADPAKLGDGKALALSPDARWVLALIETPRSKLVLLPTGAGESRPLPIQDLGSVYWAKWLDTHRIVVAAAGADTIPRSFIYDIDIDRSTPFADVGSLAVLPSRDRKHIVVLDPLSGYYLWPVAGGDPVHLDGIGLEERPVQWSDDGRFLYLHAEDQRALKIYRYAIAGGRRELWREVKPGDPAGLVGIAVGRGEVAVTPDGKTLAFTCWYLLDDLILVDWLRR